MQEAQLFVELRACACGGGQAVADHELQQRGGEMVARFRSTCSSCDGQQDYEVVVPSKQVLPQAFGGPEPSTLVDPGEFLWASDQAAARVPVDVSRLDQGERSAAAGALRYAIATLDEVIKFIAVGAHRVPAEAFTTELGRAMYQADPERFTVTGLREQIASYRAGLTDLQQTIPADS